MKADEERFLRELERMTAAEPDRAGKVRACIATLGMHHKRAAYILSKWTDRGWYDYGVTVFAGWLTEAGRAAGQSMREERAFEALIVAVTRGIDPVTLEPMPDDTLDPDRLPELTPEERAAMDALPPTLVDDLFREAAKDR